jgi:hypothetical protein
MPPRPCPLSWIALVLCFALAACEEQPSPETEPAAAPNTAQFAAEAAHAPPFMRVPYERFTRADAIAIAEQEWRLFGQPINDNPPPPDDAELAPEDYPERFPGLWERVGEYWWLGQNADRPEAAWTGMHDERGDEFEARRDGEYAWSAAFISYVMRTAGAGARFPYASSHFVYVDIAKKMKLGQATGWVVVAERLSDYAPVPGDLICYSREKRRVTYEQLPRRHFAGHCDIVVARGDGQISVIGGNVFNAVTMKHVPVTADGALSDANGRVLDTRYAWFVTLRVAYDR